MKIDRPALLRSAHGTINILILWIAWISRIAQRLQEWLESFGTPGHPSKLWTTLPAFFAIACIVFAIVNLPWEIRRSRFSAKLIDGAIQRAAMAFVGGAVMLSAKLVMPRGWIIVVAILCFLAAIRFGFREAIIASIYLTIGAWLFDKLFPNWIANERAMPLYLVWHAMLFTVWVVIAQRNRAIESAGQWLCSVAKSRRV